MSNASRHDAWQAGESYDRYMGRWSRQIAPGFLDWLAIPNGLDWLELGCGTGALSAAVLTRCSPKTLLCLDSSESFVAMARDNLLDECVDVWVGDAQALPVDAGSKDVIVSGLVMNFVPDKERALAEMKRVARMGATVGFYVWDYPGGGVEFLHAFWKAAAAVDTNASDLNEEKRFPSCTPEGLITLVKKAGLLSAEVVAVEIPTVFADFEDYWHPFMLGAGPAPGYCIGLAVEARQRLKERLYESLPRCQDGSIHLQARAWAVRATVS